MSRRSKLALIIGTSLAGLIILAAVAGVFVLQSQWLRERIRQRIVTEAETASGGRVEIGAFRFDWRTLTAEVNGLVIHGSEPPGAEPLLRVQSIAVRLKVVSFLRQIIDVESVDAEAPQAHLIVYPDGATNVPHPKLRASEKNPIAVILDLAIGEFRARDGLFEVNSQRLPWQAAGRNLQAKLTYNRASPSYNGDLSMQQLHFAASKDLPVDMAVQISLAVERNKLIISHAHVQTSESFADLSGAIDSFLAPEYHLQYTARISLPELVRTLRFHAHPEGNLLINGNASFRDFGHYLLTGRLAGYPLTFGQRKVRVHGVRAEAEFRVDPQRIDFSNVRLAALDGRFVGRARVEQLDRMRLEGDVENFDLQRIAEAFALGPLPWDGVLSGPVALEGLISELNQGKFTAHCELVVAPAPRRAPVRGAIVANYDGYRNSVDLGRSFLQLPSTRLDFAGTLGHQLRVGMQSTDLRDLLPALAMVSNTSRPVLPVRLQNGSAAFSGTVTGPLSAPQVAGHFSLQNFVYSRQQVDSLAADLAVLDSGLRVQNGVIARGSLSVQFAGAVSLNHWKPQSASQITFDASLRGGDIHDMLALAGRPHLPVSGSLSGSAQLSGSLAKPRLNALASVTHGSLYGETFDRLSLRADYEDNTATSSGQLDTEGKQLTLDATYVHSPADFGAGRIVFHAASNGMPVDRFEFARLRELPLSGSVQFTAKGAGEIAGAKNGGIAFRLTGFDADVQGRNMRLAQRPIGVVHLMANTAGSALTVQLQSAVANSIIHVDGRWSLADDYPGGVQVTFSKVELSSLESWLGLPASQFQVNGSLAGKGVFTGPALKPEAWTGTLEIPELDIAPNAKDIGGAGPPAFALHNQGPILLKLHDDVLHVESARLTGQATDLTLTGTLSFKEKAPLDLRLAGTFDLATLQQFSSDLTASGKLAVNAAIQGPLEQPRVFGKLELQDADLSASTFTNGLSNANGVILFAGNRATIQNISAESGGGRVTVTGFVTQSGNSTTLRMDIAADQVRLRYPEGVSTLVNAKLTWAGTVQRSLVSGNVTILRTGFTPRTDLASLLASSAQPVRLPAGNTGLLSGIDFDVQIQTAANILVQSEMAQQIQAEANLRLRGTAVVPALLGRINITQGQLTFFGNKYTIGPSSISFLNPVKIEPTVNIDLQTKARGVYLTLNISGPMNKLNVTYRSDPPLQFSDIVALLATGRAPTGVPALTSSQTGAAQAWQQMGASTLVGQALANPGSSRLQRFFGVSKIKIDPMLTGITNPQARLTIEQPVTPDITFTYITYLTQSNPQVVQVEWSLNKQVSVVALRDENGLFGVDFYYKKGFK